MEIGRKKFFRGPSSEAAAVLNLTRSGWGWNRGYWQTAANEEMIQNHQEEIEKTQLLKKNFKSDPTYKIHLVCSGVANPYT